LLLRHDGQHYYSLAYGGTGKIHLRLVAQASQPAQMSIEGRASINGRQYSNMIFIKDIRMICLRYHLLSAQAGKPVPPDSLG
jgi:hypothetical protein